jgi:hypothetical protein
VLGYDLVRAVVDEDAVAALSVDVPDVVLVRKVYPDKEKKNKKKRARRRPDPRGPRGLGREDREAVEGTEAVTVTVTETETAIDTEVAEIGQQRWAEPSSPKRTSGTHSKSLRRSTPGEGAHTAGDTDDDHLAHELEESLSINAKNGKDMVKRGRLFVSEEDGEDDGDDAEYEEFVMALDDDDDDDDEEDEEDEEDEDEMNDHGDQEDVEGLLEGAAEWEEVEVDDLIPVADSDNDGDGDSRTIQGGQKNAKSVTIKGVSPHSL